MVLGLEELGRLEDFGRKPTTGQLRQEEMRKKRETERLAATKERLRQKVEQVSMALSERDAALAERDAALAAERALDINRDGSQDVVGGEGGVPGSFGLCLGCFGE